MNRMMKAAMALAIALGAAVSASAGIPADSLMVTITPNVYYAVLISTANVGLNLGNVDLRASTQTVNPSTVTIQSTYATTDLKLQGAITNPADPTHPWTFSASSGTYETDKLAAWAMFTDITVGTAPAQLGGYFNGTTQGTGADMFDANDNFVGERGGSETRFLAVGETGYKTMDDMPNDAVEPDISRSHLWLRFRLPGASTSNTAQNITVTLTAVAPN